MRQVRLTARGRLTILYTTMVLAAGVALTVLTYVLMRRNTEHRVSRIHLDSDSRGTTMTQTMDIVEQVRDATLTEFVTQAAVALAVITLLAAGLGWLVSGRVLRPIRAISATAKRLSAENLSERVPVTTPADELTALAGTVNGMLDRIQDGVAERDRVLESQRMFTANAAHELRTPLTTMRTAIDVTLDGEPGRTELLTMARDVRTAVEHSQRTLDGLLVLARSQAGLGERRLIDLADIMPPILDDFADKLAGRAIALRTNLEPASVHGEPVLLERMAGNLVDNAFRYNHDGGRIDVTTGTNGGWAFLRIVNAGRQIAADEAERLQEPFVHGRRDRTHNDGGAGLGLSIVRAIVLAHEGQLGTVANPDGGLDVTVDLPQLAP